MFMMLFQALLSPNVTVFTTCAYLTMFTAMLMIQMSRFVLSLYISVPESPCAIIQIIDEDDANSICIPSTLRADRIPAKESATSFSVICRLRQNSHDWGLRDGVETVNEDDDDDDDDDVIEHVNSPCPSFTCLDDLSSTCYMSDSSSGIDANGTKVGAKAYTLRRTAATGIQRLSREETPKRVYARCTTATLVAQHLRECYKEGVHDNLCTTEPKVREIGIRTISKPKVTEIKYPYPPKSKKLRFNPIKQKPINPWIARQWAIFQEYQRHKKKIVPLPPPKDWSIRTEKTVSQDDFDHDELSQPQDSVCPQVRSPEASNEEDDSVPTLVQADVSHDDRVPKICSGLRKTTSEAATMVSDSKCVEHSRNRSYVKANKEGEPEPVTQMPILLSDVKCNKEVDPEPVIATQMPILLSAGNDFEQTAVQGEDHEASVKCISWDDAVHVPPTSITKCILPNPFFSGIFQLRGDEMLPETATEDASMEPSNHIRLFPTPPPHIRLLPTPPPQLSFPHIIASFDVKAGKSALASLSTVCHLIHAYRPGKSALASLSTVRHLIHAHRAFCGSMIRSIASSSGYPFALKQLQNVGLSDFAGIDQFQCMSSMWFVWQLSIAANLRFPSAGNVDNLVIDKFANLTATTRRGISLHCDSLGGYVLHITGKLLLPCKMFDTFHSPSTGTSWGHSIQSDEVVKNLLHRHCLQGVPQNVVRLPPPSLVHQYLQVVLNQHKMLCSQGSSDRNALTPCPSSTWPLVNVLFKPTIAIPPSPFFSSSAAGTLLCKPPAFSFFKGCWQHGLSTVPPTRFALNALRPRTISEAFDAFGGLLPLGFAAFGPR